MPDESKFADYLKGQPESFQREWLGSGRYELYKTGKLTLEHMVKPDRGFKRTITELEAAILPEQVKTSPVTSVSESAPAQEITKTTTPIKTIEDILSSPAVAELNEKLTSVTETYEKESARLAKEREELTEKIKKYSKAFRQDGLIDWDKMDFTASDRVALETIRKEERRVLDEYRRTLQKERITCFKALFPVTDEHNIKFAKKVMKKLKCSQDSKDDIAAMVGGMLERLGISVQIPDVELKVTVRNLKTFNARASAGAWKKLDGTFKVELNLPQNESVPTVVHEWGHIAAGLTRQPSQLADQDHLFGKNLVQWYEDNAKGEEKTGEIFGFATPDDKYRDLPIKVPDWYSAKSTGREMESTFFEYLFLDPAKLVREYPDFVKLVLGMMK